MVMTINTAKLREIIPDLEARTGGERRDLDAKIAEVCGWIKVKQRATGSWQGVPPNRGGWFKPIPHYLGTEAAIATEEMQRLVSETGLKWEREEFPLGCTEFCVIFDEGDWIGAEETSLPLAWARAVIAKEDGR